MKRLLQRIPKFLFGAFMGIVGLTIGKMDMYVKSVVVIMFKSTIEFTPYNLTIFTALVLLLIFLLFVALFFILLGLTIMIDAITED